MYLLYVPLACSALLQLEGIYDWELTGAQGYSCSSFPGPHSLHRFLFTSCLRDMRHNNLSIRTGLFGRQKSVNLFWFVLIASCNG